MKQKVIAILLAFLMLIPSPGFSLAPKSFSADPSPYSGTGQEQLLQLVRDMVEMHRQTGQVSRSQFQRSFEAIPPIELRSAGAARGPKKATADLMPTPGDKVYVLIEKDNPKKKKKIYGLVRFTDYNKFIDEQSLNPERYKIGRGSVLRFVPGPDLSFRVYKKQGNGLFEELPHLVVRVRYDFSPIVNTSSYKYRSQKFLEVIHFRKENSPIPDAPTIELTLSVDGDSADAAGRQEPESVEIQAIPAALAGAEETGVEAGTQVVSAEPLDSDDQWNHALGTEGVYTPEFEKHSKKKVTKLIENKNYVKLIWDHEKEQWRLKVSKDSTISKHDIRRIRKKLKELNQLFPGSVLNEVQGVDTEIFLLDTTSAVLAVKKGEVQIARAGSNNGEGIFVYVPFSQFLNVPASLWIEDVLYEELEQAIVKYFARLDGVEPPLEFYSEWLHLAKLQELNAILSHRTLSKWLKPFAEATPLRVIRIPSETVKKVPRPQVYNYRNGSLDQLDQFKTSITPPKRNPQSRNRHVILAAAKSKFIGIRNGIIVYLGLLKALYPRYEDPDHQDHKSYKDGHKLIARPVTLDGQNKIIELYAPVTGDWYVRIGSYWLVQDGVEHPVQTGDYLPVHSQPKLPNLKSLIDAIKPPTVFVSKEKKEEFGLVVHEFIKKILKRVQQLKERKVPKREWPQDRTLKRVQIEAQNEFDRIGAFQVFATFDSAKGALLHFPTIFTEIDNQVTGSKGVSVDLHQERLNALKNLIEIEFVPADATLESAREQIDEYIEEMRDLKGERISGEVSLDSYLNAGGVVFEGRYLVVPHDNLAFKLRPIHDRFVGEALPGLTLRMTRNIAERFKKKKKLSVYFDVDVEEGQLDAAASPPLPPPVPPADPGDPDRGAPAEPAQEPEAEEILPDDIVIPRSLTALRNGSDFSKQKLLALVQEMIDKVLPGWSQARKLREAHAARIAAQSGFEKIGPIVVNVDDGGNALISLLAYEFKPGMKLNGKIRWTQLINKSADNLIFQEGDEVMLLPDADLNYQLLRRKKGSRNWHLIEGARLGVLKDDRFVQVLVDRKSDKGGKVRNPKYTELRFEEGSRPEAGENSLRLVVRRPGESAAVPAIPSEPAEEEAVVSASAEEDTGEAVGAEEAVEEEAEAAAKTEEEETDEVDGEESHEAPTAAVEEDDESLPAGIAIPKRVQELRNDSDAAKDQLLTLVKGIVSRINKSWSSNRKHREVSSARRNAQSAFEAIGPIIVKVEDGGNALISMLAEDATRGAKLNGKVRWTDLIKKSADKQILEEGDEVMLLPGEDLSYKLLRRKKGSRSWYEIEGAGLRVLNAKRFVQALVDRLSDSGKKTNKPKYMELHFEEGSRPEAEDTPTQITVEDTTEETAAEAPAEEQAQTPEQTPESETTSVTFLTEEENDRRQKEFAGWLHSLIQRIRTKHKELEETTLSQEEKEKRIKATRQLQQRRFLELQPFWIEVDQEPDFREDSEAQEEDLSRWVTHFPTLFVDKENLTAAVNLGAIRKGILERLSGARGLGGDELRAAIDTLEGLELNKVNAKGKAIGGEVRLADFLSQIGRLEKGKYLLVPGENLSFTVRHIEETGDLKDPVAGLKFRVTDAIVKRFVSYRGRKTQKYIDLVVEKPAESPVETPPAADEEETILIPESIETIQNETQRRSFELFSMILELINGNVDVYNPSRKHKEIIERASEAFTNLGPMAVTVKRDLNRGKTDGPPAFVSELYGTISPLTKINYNGKIRWTKLVRTVPGLLNEGDVVILLPQEDFSVSILIQQEDGTWKKLKTARLEVSRELKERFVTRTKGKTASHKYLDLISKGFSKRVPYDPGRLFKFPPSSLESAI